MSMHMYGPWIIILTPCYHRSSRWSLPDCKTLHMSFYTFESNHVCFPRISKPLKSETQIRVWLETLDSRTGSLCLVLRSKKHNKGRIQSRNFLVCQLHSPNSFIPPLMVSFIFTRCSTLLGTLLLVHKEECPSRFLILCAHVIFLMARKEACKGKQT